MDLGFFRRAEMRFAGRSAARIDYGVLVATLQTHQSTSPAARALRESERAPGATPGRYPAVEIILAGPAWQQAIEAQGGGFRRAPAQQMGKAA